jgi:hypothetical protein
MFEDVKRMLTLRKQEKAILAAEIHGEATPRLVGGRTAQISRFPYPIFVGARALASSLWRIATSIAMHI